MADFYEVKDQAGTHEHVTDSQGFGDSGYREESFLAAAVFETVIDATVAVIMVEDTGVGNSEIFTIKNLAATPTLAVSGTPNAAFNLAKDNAATINVYLELNTATPAALVVKVQNNSAGGDTSLVVKAYV